MHIKTNIKRTNLELTNDVQVNINEKVNNLEKFMSLKENETPILDIQLENKYAGHHKQGEIYRAELNLQYKGKVFRTESKSEDIKVAFNDAHSEMVRRVRKSREKKMDFIRGGAERLKRMMRFGR